MSISIVFIDCRIYNDVNISSCHSLVFKDSNKISLINILPEAAFTIHSCNMI